MDVVYLLNCAKTKVNHTCSALEMWGNGRLFRKCLMHARANVADDHIRIITFSHGANELTDLIDPYDRPPTSFSPDEKMRGMSKAVVALGRDFDLSNTHFVLLTTAPYNKYLVNMLPNTETPLDAMAMGDRLSWLNGTMKVEGGMKMTAPQIREQLATLSTMIEALNTSMDRLLGNVTELREQVVEWKSH